MLRHEIAGECYTHQHLWNCAEALLAQPATQSPKDGYFQMAGMLMAYFTFEAYLNLVGPRIDREAWKNERIFFNTPPYRGTPGKLKRICEKLGIHVEAGKRPYQTLRELRRLRDSLAHGRSQSYGYSLLAREGQRPDLFRGLTIYNSITRRKAERALKDTEEFIEFLHAKINQKTPRDDIPFKGKALEFPLAWATGVARRP